MSYSNCETHSAVAGWQLAVCSGAAPGGMCLANYLDYKVISIVYCSLLRYTDLIICNACAFAQRYMESLSSLLGTLVVIHKLSHCKQCARTKLSHLHTCSYAIPIKVSGPLCSYGVLSHMQSHPQTPSHTYFPTCQSHPQTPSHTFP